jgi:hypothetical protein
VCSSDLNWTKVSSGDLGYAYDFSCYWDEPRYWLQALTTLDGGAQTSAAALRKIATVYCKFTWHSENVSSTDDEQFWIPANQPLSVFARAIAQRGRVNDQSHMIFGIDSVGAMRYMNVNKNIGEGTLRNAVSTQALSDNLPGGVTKIFVAQETSFRTRAGLYNSLGGYAYTLVEQFFKEPEEVVAYEGDLLSSFTSVMDSNEASRNTNIPVIIENRSIVDFAPVGVKGPDEDGGTVHENFEKAYAQNYLFNLLNSTSGDFAFNRITDFEMGDRFYYRPPIGDYASTGATLDDEAAGEFTVYAKTVYAAGGVYLEKVSACRNGTGRKQ